MLSADFAKGKSRHFNLIQFGESLQEAPANIMQFILAVLTIAILGFSQGNVFI